MQLLPTCLMDDSPAALDCVTLMAHSLDYCYHEHMLKKPLIDTNPYLRDPEMYRKALITSVASSTAIETGASVASIIQMLEADKDVEPLTMMQGSAR